MENDEDFVKRARKELYDNYWESQSGFSLAETDHLLDLATRGAAVQWRPIEEWDKGQVYLDAGGNRWVWDSQISHAPENRRPFWNTDTMSDSWNRTHQPTFGIPLSALGEPK